MRTRLLDPGSELLADPPERVRGEAAAAVDGRLVARAAEEVDERQPEQPRLQVPERQVD
jgi:hypothetical protein